MKPSRPGGRSEPTAPTDLYDYARPRATRPRGRPARDLSDWQVSDDWPERVPVTEAELDLFEAWFGDLFDEIFGSAG